jgi:enamine deaminase RidA (YjgF/YER057c/UK114 family)
MTPGCINPEDLPAPLTYTQVVAATGSRLVFVAGQEPEDEHGNLAGPGDLAVQARQVSANLGRAPAAAGARPDQETKITIFVAGYRRDECLPTIEEGRVALLGDHKPADTLAGVQALSPGYLIEAEAIAVADGQQEPQPQPLKILIHKS